MEYYDIVVMKALLRTAGQRALAHFRQVTPVWKANHTYVTQADIEVQMYLQEELEGRFPDDGLIGEEHDLAKAPRQGDCYWVLGFFLSTLDNLTQKNIDTTIERARMR